MGTVAASVSAARLFCRPMITPGWTASLAGILETIVGIDFFTQQM